MTETHLPFPPGIRQITVEVCRFGPGWQPEMFMCRIYGLNFLDRRPTGFAMAPNPSAAIRRALEGFERDRAGGKHKLPTEKEAKAFKYRPPGPLEIDPDLADLI